MASEVFQYFIRADYELLGSTGAYPNTHVHIIVD